MRSLRNVTPTGLVFHGITEVWVFLNLCEFWLLRWVGAQPRCLGWTFGLEIRDAPVDWFEANFNERGVGATERSCTEEPIMRREW